MKLLLLPLLAGPAGQRANLAPYLTHHAGFPEGWVELGVGSFLHQDALKRLVVFPLLSEEASGLAF